MKLENKLNLSRNATIALVLIITVSGASVGVVFGVVHSGESPIGTPPAYQPIALDKATFNVYSWDAASQSQGSLLASDVPANTMWGGGTQYPDIELVYSGFFPVDRYGNPAKSPLTVSTPIVINGVGYIITETHWGFMFGARTHVNWGSIILPNQGATVSPFLNGGYTHVDQAGNQFGEVWTDPATGASKYTGTPVGSLVYTCDAYQADNVVWGAATSANAAKITQSIAPFQEVTKTPIYGTMKIDGVLTKILTGYSTSSKIVTDLDANWFKTYASQSEGNMKTWIAQNTKTAQVCIVPKFTVQCMGPPVAFDYTQKINMPDGSNANVTIEAYQAYSGFRDVYATQNPDYIQRGQITNNMKQVFNVSIQPAGEPTGNYDPGLQFPGTSPPQNRGNNILGSLWYYGVAKTDTVSGASIVITNIGTNLSSSYRNYAFSASHPDSAGSMPRSVTINGTIILQPDNTVSWANMQMTDAYYIWDGADGPFNCYGWSMQGGTTTPVSIIYPFYMSAANSYGLNEAVLEQYSISKCDLNFESNGQPINASKYTDNELTKVLNTPWTDNTAQQLAIPYNLLELILILVIVAVAVIAVSTIVVVIVRRKQNGGGESHSRWALINFGNLGGGGE